MDGTNREQRLKYYAEVHEERDRLLPLREQSTELTIETMRANGRADLPDLIPYLNLSHLMLVKRAKGDDALLAFALSLANWATAALKDLAMHTGRTFEEVIDQYETSLMEKRLADAGEDGDPGGPRPDLDDDFGPGGP
jgi:hypothetical protein